MSLINISKEMFDNGVFVFDNGNYIFIEEIQYSGDGIYWEDTFNPNSHTDPRDPTNTLDGHKWRRVRHAGDGNYQVAEYIVAEDGKTPVFRINSNNLEYKYSGADDSTYVVISPMSALKGIKGDKGDTGEGWNIDVVSYWLEKPDCASSAVSSSITSCPTCTPSTTTATCDNNLTLMLSLGDGLKAIVIGDVGDFRSNDGITWIEIVSTDIGNYTRFTATDAIGTGSVDYHTQDTLSTKGKVYYCNEGVWTLFLNVAISDHKVAPTEAFETAFNSGFFIDDYTVATLNSNFIYGTIALTPDFKLVVKQDSLEPIHFKDGSFGDGLDEGVVNSDGIKTSPIKVKTTDFSGYGLNTYTRSDGNDDLEVDVPNLVGDGMYSYLTGSPADGEDDYIFNVKVANLFEATNGLQTVVGVDGFNDMAVLSGKGIAVDANGVNADVDNTSMYTDGSDKISIKNGTSGSDGVLAKHLNSDTVNEDKGLELDNTTGIAVKLSPTAPQPLDFDNTGLFIKEDGVHGFHLNKDVIDEAGGLTYDDIADTIQSKVTVGGGLQIVATGLQIDTGDLSWMNNAVVKKVEVWDYSGHTNFGDIHGDIAIEGDVSSDTYMQIKLSLVGNTITIAPETNLGALTALITATAPSAVTSLPWTSITGKPTDRVIEDTVYGGNMKITDNGLFLQAPNGDWGKLIIVDDNFSLGIDETATP